MVYAQPNICPGEWHRQTPMGFWHTNGSLNHGQTTRPNNNLINKKRTCKIVDFAVPADYRVRLKENEKIKYLDLTKKQKKTEEHESDVYTNCNWCFWCDHQGINKRTGGLRNKRTSGDHPNYYTIEIVQNTEKSPGDLRRLAVTQTSVRDHQLTLLWKTLQE